MLFSQGMAGLIMTRLAIRGPFWLPHNRSAGNHKMILDFVAPTGYNQGVFLGYYTIRIKT